MMTSQAVRSAQKRFEPFAAMVEKHFDVVTKGSNEWMVFCPFHHNVHTPAMSINVETGAYICYNADCGAHGGAKSLRRHCGERIENQEEYDLAEVRARLHSLMEPEDSNELRPKHESFLRRFAFPTSYWGYCTDDCAPHCADHRGLDDRIIAAFDLGFDPLANHATIPVRNRHAELLGVIRRDLDPLLDKYPNAPKYLYPKGFKKTRDMFASWFADQSDTNELVLVEGSVDCMKVWQAGFVCMATYGNHISAEQVRMIRRMGFTKVTLFFDNDRAGQAATRVALGESTQMRRGKPRKVYDPETDLRRDCLVNMVRHQPGWKDPGSLDTVSIATLIVEAKRVQ